MPKSRELRFCQAGIWMTLALRISLEIALLAAVDFAIVSIAIGFSLYKIVTR